ncbi:MAG: GMC family oxidoreductase N-terminal domain-containing protein, partial [bacterium]
NLAAQGKEVLVVERGKYVQPKDFNEDEGDMIGKLYADGIFQQTTDFRFTVLQGSCVGGTTVINNAVSFDPPEHVLDHWNKKYDAGIDKQVLKDSTEEIRKFLHICPQVSQHAKGKLLQKEYLQGKKNRQGEDILNPSWRQFVYGVQNLGLEKFDEGNGIRKILQEEAGRLRLGDSLLLERVHGMAADVVEANIVDCLGCGYCNIGCKYGKKMSMLDKMLPEAQKLERGKVRILAECEVERIRTLSGKPERVADIKARLSDGRKLTIRADKYILSAGAIASSFLLLRSRIGRNLPVGRHVSFNMGAPMTAEFADTLDAYDGLQISHYGIPRVLHKPHLERGFVLETWWNPPVAQAISMPGWFEEHFRNMQNFNKMMGLGVLVGTDNTARVKQALTGGADIDFVPTRVDLLKLADGLIQAGEVLFAAGARRLMLNTWGNDSFNHPNQLPRINEIVKDPRYLTLGTGHPQGGNGISKDPFKGVVGEDFKVHGYSNLFVCDASVFPSSLTVNPQLTIMALAHYAAKIIAQ